MRRRMELTPGEVQGAVRRAEIFAEYKEALVQASNEARRRAREAAACFSDALGSATK